MVVTLFSIITAAAVTFLYLRGQQLEQNQLSNQQIKSLVNKVGKLVELPEEEPTVATVTDKEKLSNQAFFERSENGDRVLIFQEAKKAYLYRPSTNKIIEIAPLSAQQTPTESAPTPAPQPAKISIYNGTTVVGLTNKFEKELVAKEETATITTKKNAAKTHPTSTITDVTGTHQELVTELAETFKLEIATLPEGESVTDSDILIILGQDRTPEATQTPSPTPEAPQQP